MKNVHCFSHDSDARHDSKVTAMRAKYGAEGYGWFWMVIESMCEHKDYVIPTSDKHWLNSLSIDLSIKTSDLKGFIDDCINKFELFVETDGVIYSESLLKRMKRVERRSKQATNAANSRWGKGRDSKDKKPPEEKEVIEEAPRKKKKSSKQKSFSVLTDDKHWKEFLPEVVGHKEIGGRPEEFYEKQRSRCVDWVRSRNKQTLYKNFRAMFFNWIRSKIEYMEKDSKSGKSKTGMIF